METLVHKLDSYEEIQKRQRIFAQAQAQEQEAADKNGQNVDQDEHDVNA
jgi:hypothetical protein